MYRGVNSINIDAKGRMALPTRYRDSVSDRCAGRLVVTAHQFDQCLALYLLPDWEEAERKVAALPDGNAYVRNMKRRFIGQACDVDLDASGRLLVPPKLREFAGLDKKVVLIGQRNRFEIWSDEAWSATEELSGSLDEALMPDFIQELSL